MFLHTVIEYEVGRSHASRQGTWEAVRQFMVVQVKINFVSAWDDVDSNLSIKFNRIFLDLGKKQSFDFLRSIFFLKNRTGYADAM